MTLEISVALCTYQGERYLDEQLSTIGAQSRPPDEVVVTDDGSTDRTLDILRAFADAAPFPVRVHRNSVNLGSTKNFERAISLCAGHVIALADQDDAWVPQKIERIHEIFEEDPRLTAIFTDAELIDDRSRALGPGLWEWLGFNERTQDLFFRREAHRILTIGNVATGATMAFRAEMRDLLLPIPQGWVQDYWIVVLLSTVSDVRPVPDRLIRYRLHAAQQIGVPQENRPLTAFDHVARRAQLRRRMRKNERADMRTFAESFEEAVRRLEERADRFPPRSQTLRYLRGKVNHMRVRGGIGSAHPRVPLVAQELFSGRYHRYSGGWKSAMKDAMWTDREPTGLPEEEGQERA